MSIIKNRGGRPQGSKDKKPRITKDRAEKALFTIASAGFSTGEIALENLSRIDYLIDCTIKERDVFNSIVDKIQNSQELKHNDIVKCIAGINTLDGKLLKLMEMRQKWLSDISKFTDYAKGQETVIQTGDGEVTTFEQLLAAPKKVPQLTLDGDNDE